MYGMFVQCLPLQQLQMKIITLLILLTITLYTVFSFWEPAEFEHASVPYYLKVHNEIKSAPLLNPTSLPTYKVRIADGEKPAMTIVNYCSAKPLDLLRTHFMDDSFNCIKGQHFNGLECTKRTAQFYITAIIEPGKACTQVFKTYTEIQ